MKHRFPHRNQRTAIALMHILVIAAIAIVVGTLAVATYGVLKSKKNKAVALQNLKDLAMASKNFATENNDELPREDAADGESWRSVVKEENKNVWYNALPKAMGRRSLAEYAASPRDFYQSDNPLYIPGADYPETDRKLTKPFFAIAMNSNLEQRKEDGTKPPVKRADIANPARTVLLFERGLSSEPEYLAVMQKKDDFTGEPKGSGEDFVARYRGKGIVAFVEGNAEEFEVSELLTETGDMAFPGPVIWGRNAEQDPNEDSPNKKEKDKDKKK